MVFYGYQKIKTLQNNHAIFFCFISLQRTNSHSCTLTLLTIRLLSMYSIIIVQNKNTQNINENKKGDTPWQILIAA